MADKKLGHKRDPAERSTGPAPEPRPRSSIALRRDGAEIRLPRCARTPTMSSHRQELSKAGVGQDLARDRPCHRDDLEPASGGCATGQPGAVPGSQPEAVRLRTGVAVPLPQPAGPREGGRVPRWHQAAGPALEPHGPDHAPSRSRSATRSWSHPPARPRRTCPTRPAARGRPDTAQPRSTPSCQGVSRISRSSCQASAEVRQTLGALSRLG